ncbi:MAG: hypothetical protein B6D43_06785 [Ignavibacteriales bacterium UTCHB1]|nr:PBP1A family penicillin-binding protein [Ignavibacteria bacterium]OQY77310.1 MAG: hypothetical protein B6D43_06785 [Ignavibacteriales bacterium UTCHB1]
MAKKSNNKEKDLDKYFSDKDFRRKKVRKKKFQRVSFSFVFFSMLFIILAFCGYLFYLTQSLPSLSELENPKLEEATEIYSDDGVLIDKFFLKNRTQVTIDNIAPVFIQALIATEDRKFYDHWGVDIQRIVQAFVKNIIAMDLTKEGASTITQQLARNLYIGDEVTLNRKLREAMTAVQIEKTYTKEEILAYYCNTVYFGNGAYGIEAAAQTYFSKSAKDLNLNEAATLVGVLKSPTNYDPVDKMDNSFARRNIVLKTMVESGYITPDQYELTSKDPIKLTQKIEEEESVSIAPEFTEYVRQTLQRRAKDYGYDLYRDGLKVYTTIDTRFQKHAEDAVNEHLANYQKSFNRYWSWRGNQDVLNSAISRHIKFSEEYKKAETEEKRQQIFNRMKNDPNVIDTVKKLITTIQVGFVVLDPKTGEIKAMVGANPKVRTKYGLNHVTQIKRQPGSTFKPFVYAVALNNGYTPSYMISNDPIKVNVGGRIWSPKGGGTGGKVSMRTALAKSINVVAVRTAMDLAPINQVIDLAHEMGITTEIPNYLSISLGSAEVIPLEITNAFGTFANDGIWVEPIAIKRIEDRNGNLIDEFLPNTREVLSEGVAYMMSDMLQDVINGGTASTVRNFFHRPAAGKTGTSQSYTDAWFIGYTPQFVAGVWVGFDDARINFGGSYGQGGQAAAPIWGRFMKKLYADEDFDFPVAYFLMPEGVEEVSICTITGLSANSTCPSVKEIVSKKLIPRRCPVTHYFETEDTVSQEIAKPPGSNESLN